MMLTLALVALVVETGLLVYLAVRVYREQTCASCGHAWDEHPCLTQPRRTALPTCERCGKTLMPNALRTHDGHFYCPAHKGRGDAA